MVSLLLEKGYAFLESSTGQLFGKGNWESSKIASRDSEGFMPESISHQIDVHMTPLFRIRKVFDQEGISIIKVEGDVTTGNFQDWAEKVGSCLDETKLPIILDFSSVGFLTPKVVELFHRVLKEHIYIINLPSSTKNIVESAGLSQHVIA